MENYKRTIKFHDTEDMIVISELSISNKNGYPEFTMCNEKNSCSGQTPFVPKNKWQKKLNAIWERYHLNNMSAGLLIQEKAIAQWKKAGNRYDYDKVIEYLKSINIYEIPLKINLPKNYFIVGKKDISDTEIYRYGTSWVHCYLPEGFINTLNEVCDNIEKEEKERFADKESITFEDIKDAKIIALGKHLNITPIEANEDITHEEDCRYLYSGIRYLVCTNAEANKLWNENLENYIDECLEIPKNILNYFNRESWKFDARMDGRGNSLARYDGKEDKKDVDGITYYIYRQ